jgi:hypothetical protein
VHSIPEMHVYLKLNKAALTVSKCWLGWWWSVHWHKWRRGANVSGVKYIRKNTLLK